MKPTVDTIRELIAQRLSHDLGTLKPETTLESLGIDSLAKIELLFDLEDHLGMKLPDPEGPVNTIQDLADHIDHARLSQSGS